MWTNWDINSIGVVQTGPDGTISVPVTLADSSGKVLGDFEIQQQGSNVVAIRIPSLDMYVVDIVDVRTLQVGDTIKIGPAIPKNSIQ